MRYIISPPEEPQGNYYNAVTQGGIDNTGDTSVTSAIGTCITAYKNGGYDGLYFPAGTYLLSTILTVPESTTFIGQGSGSWLKGRVKYNGHSSFSQLKIGNTGYAGAYAVLNVNSTNTHYTTFEGCEFIGSHYDADVSSNCAPVVFIYGSASNLGFTNCTVGESDYNGITVNAVDSTTSPHDITFQGCHILEAQRMGFECTNRNTTLGWSAINLIDCLFEITGSESISYDSLNGVDTGHSLVQDVTCKGSGNSTYFPNPATFEINGPRDMEVTRLTCYRSWSNILNFQGPSLADGSQSIPSEWVFTDCVFDESVNYLTRSGHITPYAMCGFHHRVDGAVFDNCTFNVGTSLHSHHLQIGDDASSVVCSDNDFSTCTFTGTKTTAYDVKELSGSGNVYPDGTTITYS